MGGPSFDAPSAPINQGTVWGRLGTDRAYECVFGYVPTQADETTGKFFARDAKGEVLAITDTRGEALSIVYKAAREAAAIPPSPFVEPERNWVRALPLVKHDLRRLNAADEWELIQRAQQGDNDAWWQILMTHQGLIRNISKKYRYCGEDPSRLFNMAHEVFEKAIYDFDGERGCRFTTYAGKNAKLILRKYAKKLVKAGWVNSLNDGPVQSMNTIDGNDEPYVTYADKQTTRNRFKAEQVYDPERMFAPGDDNAAILRDVIERADLTYEERRVIEGLHTAERVAIQILAAELGMSLKGVEQTKARAFEKLRRTTDTMAVC